MEILITKFSALDVFSDALEFIPIGFTFGIFVCVASWLIGYTVFKSFGLFFETGNKNARFKL